MHHALCGLPHQSIWVKLRSLYCRVIGIFFAISKAQNTKRRFDKRNTYKQNVFCYCNYVVVVVDPAFSAAVQFMVSNVLFCSGFLFYECFFFHCSSFTLQLKCYFTCFKTHNKLLLNISSILSPIACRTNVKKFSVFLQGHKFYNSLGSEIANANLICFFMKALKQTIEYILFSSLLIFSTLLFSDLTPCYYPFKLFVKST